MPDKDVEILKDKIEPLPRGWDNVEGPRKKAQTEPKIIVWNHRANSYKSYPWFLQQMDKLWEQRKDFIKEKGMEAVGPLMGPVMGKFRGKMDGKKINSLLMERIKDIL